jgi:hypothetical protein
MKSEYTLETTKTIWNDQYGYRFVVKEDGDGLGLIEVSYIETSNEGEVRLVPFDPAMASLLCKAIMEVADTILERQAAEKGEIIHMPFCDKGYGGRCSCGAK